MIKKVALGVALGCLASSAGVYADIATSTKITNVQQQLIQRLDKMENQIQNLNQQNKSLMQQLNDERQKNGESPLNTQPQQGSQTQNNTESENSKSSLKDYVHIGSYSKDNEKKSQYGTNSYRSGGRLIGYLYDDSDYGSATTFGEFPSLFFPIHALRNKEKFGVEQNDYRSLVFGGYLEADTQGWWGSQFSTPPLNTQNTNTSYASESYGSGAGIFLTTADLYMMANINKWTQAFLTVGGDQNSIEFKEAFVTFGNLSKFPMFVTLGRSRMPFGVFAGGGPWISGLSAGLFKPGYNTNITIGYEHDGLMTNLVFFMPKAENPAVDASGNAIQPANGNYQGNFMYSAFYHGQIPDTKINYGWNFGYLYNLANTTLGAGKQLNTTVGPTTGLLNRQDRNSVLNFEGNVAYRDFSLFAGLTTTTMERKYTNNSRAGAWYAQFSYSPKINIFGSDKETTFSVAYNGAYNTQNLPVEFGGNAGDGVSVVGVQKQIVTFVQREVFSQVFMGLEYAWMGMYDGKHSNEVTLDTSVYF